MVLGTILKKRTARVCTATLMVIVGLLLEACSSPPNAQNGSAPVVGSFFPIAATLRALGGPAITVRDLTPPGVEPHEMELTTDQMDVVLDAELVVVMGQGFQPAVDRAALMRDGGTVVLLDRLQSGSDPHIWLDPVAMGRGVRIMAAALEQRFPNHRVEVERRLAGLRRELAALHREYRAGLADCERSTIVTAHDAFGRMARRYGLRQEAIAGIDVTQEPDPRRIAELADLVRRRQITTVFTERLVSPRIAQTLAREAGVGTAVLDPIESPPGGSATFDAYLTVMRRNLIVVQRALGCPNS